MPHEDLRKAALRLVDEADSDTEGWLDDEDDFAATAAQLDRLEERMLFLAKRLEQVRTGLIGALHGEGRVAVGV